MKFVECPVCKGSGDFIVKKSRYCEKCQGTGLGLIRECVKCRGGKLVTYCERNVCNKCHGASRIPVYGI